MPEEDALTGMRHTQLERDRGFLIYMDQTYPAMVPYLKGIFLTLDGWRGGERRGEERRGEERREI
jgi:hypothetical protein